MATVIIKHDYKKTQWIDNYPPSIDEWNLNHMEEGIYINSLRVNELIDLTSLHSDQIAELQKDVAALEKRMDTAEADIRSNRNGIADLDSKKANKSDVPAKAEMQSAVNSAASSAASQLQDLQNQMNQNQGGVNGKISDVQQALNNKLNRNGDNTGGNYTFSGSVSAATLGCTQNRIKFGSATLFISGGDPGGSNGDVWIKNS